MNYFIDEKGRFLGGFEAEIPEGAIEVPNAPPSGDFRYENGAWVAPKTYYRSQRLMAYPSVTDQLDMQFHDLLDGTTTWKDAIMAVKHKFPKP